MKSFPLTWTTVALSATLGGVVVALAAMHQLPAAVATMAVGYIGGLLTPSSGKANDQ